MNTATEIPTTLVIDKGPVWDAARILVGSTTLTDHIDISDENEWTATVEQWGDIPFDLWGSGTQALWQLLCSIAYVRCEVSLYEVASRCDSSNRRSIVAAMQALFA